MANRAWLVLCCTLLAATLCIAETPNSFATEELTENTWTVLPEQPYTLFAAVAVVDGKIYATGFDSTGKNFVIVYDPQTSTWNTKYPSVDKPWDGAIQPAVFATAVFKDKIYCFGAGVYREGIINNKVYDTNTNHWSNITPDPHSRYAPSACAVNDIIYVMGGGGDGPGTTLVEAYNPATDTWTTKQPMNKPAGRPSAVAVENKIYVFGGDYIQVYDTLTDRWRTITEYKLDTRYVCGQGATSGKYAPQKIYLFGTEKVLVFNPQTETVETKFTYPFFSTIGYYQSFNTAVIADIFYLIGGGGSGHMIDYMYVPLGYSATSPNDGAGGGLSLVFTVAGIIVAAVVIAAVGVLMFYRKPKQNKSQLL
ncbi:MAG: hypothetical protein NWF01_02555 [Candidatus Bathyarchaeota archaeon]|nr:hypothetical protein [Candidatus Bathyarchaeota archaeon]